MRRGELLQRHTVDELVEPLDDPFTPDLVAVPNPLEDQLTVWSSTQMPHAARRLLCDIIGLHESQIRVVIPDVGGGFGPKLVFYPEDVAVSVAARAA